MASSVPRKFTGSAKDYLDWLSLDISYEKVIIPESQTDCEGLPASEDDFPPPLPDYLRHDLGEEYVKKHQEAFFQEYENFRDTDIAENRTQKANIEFLEEDTMTQSLAGDRCEDKQLKQIEVYLHYDFSKKKCSSHLPVFDFQKEILDKIAKHQVLVIEGETGCGKSTQVPQFILDEAAEELKPCNIIVTQPRKIAATSLAQRICLERDWVLGKLVGYQVGLDNCTDADTRLSFVTTEILVQKLIHRRSLDAYTHIILDEVHERDQHTDFALLIVKKLLYTVSRHVKVILMSATIDTAKFAQYFSTPVMDQLIPAPIVSVGDMRVHKIQIFYLESLSIICRGKPHILSELPKINPTDPGISDDMYKLVIDMVKCFDNLERAEEGIKKTSKFASKRGAVLIFLPGLYEIENLIGYLDDEKFKHQWQLYPLHSAITQEEQLRVFQPSHGEFRKIIFSTNIAESSITVSDIKYVIDFCLTKEVSCDTRTNYTSLKVTWTSKASCKQRAGRAGRVSSGRVYRLIPQHFYETLADFSTPEICRTPLNQVVLKTKILDIGEPHALLALALDPPNLADIHHTILSLKQMGALTVKSRGIISNLNGNLTYLGKVMAILPVDPHLAKLIVMGHIFGCLRETIIIAAGLSLKSIHARPFQDELNAFLSKVSWAYGSFSDCLAVLNAYDLWQSLQVDGTFMRPGTSHEAEWAKRCYIQLRAIIEVDTLVKELQSRLAKVKICLPVSENLPKRDLNLVLKISLASAFFPYYYKRAITDDHEREIARVLSGHDPFSTVIVSGLPPETNILYDDQLRVLFKDCSDNLTISYEGPKAYIQFAKTRGQTKKEDHFKDIPGECPTAMHLALKMRQIPRIQRELILNIYSHTEAKTKMNEILSGMRSANVADESRRACNLQEKIACNRVRALQSSVTTLNPPVLPSPANHIWRAHVTHVESAGHFWAISNDTKMLSNLRYIQSCIESAVGRCSAPYMNQKDIRIGQICLALYRDSDGGAFFYRVRVDEIYTNELKVKALIYFVDYGNSEIVKASELRLAPESVLKLPMLAVECMLAEIKAAKSTTGEWDERATQWMKKNAQNSDFLAQIYSVVHGVVRVKLIKLDYVGSINETLIAMGYAIKSEESYLSRQNHELRAIYSREVDDYEGNTSINALCSTLSLSSSGLKSGHGKIQLRGPDSPLLMRFVALTRTGFSKGVRVEPISVNSTALDLEPQSSYDRFLVASFVSLNANGMAVTLRNTTLMPSIPGLMALCLLMFCPTAELRVSRDLTRYIGAVIGLGSDSVSGYPIYPDEDIETEFDIEFHQEDLILINKIRFYMNVILSEGEDLIPTRLADIQKRLRYLVGILLNVERECCKGEAYLNAYRWNQLLPENLLLPDTGCAFTDSEEMVFPLINGVALQSETITNDHRDSLSELKSLEKRLSVKVVAPNSVINKECKMCDVFLKTASDLRCHLSCDTHIQKELRIM